MRAQGIAFLRSTVLYRLSGMLRRCAALHFNLHIPHLPWLGYVFNLRCCCLLLLANQQQQTRSTSWTPPHVLLSGVSVLLWLQKLTGSADGLLAAQRSPTTPLQRLATHQKEVAELVSTWGLAGMEGAHLFMSPLSLAYQEFSSSHLVALALLAALVQG
jgi:hypothetical protein